MNNKWLAGIAACLMLVATFALAHRAAASSDGASIVVGIYGGEWKTADRIEIALLAGDASGQYRFRGFDAAILEGDSEEGPFRAKAGATKRVLTDRTAISLSLGDPSAYDPSKTYAIAYRVLYSPVGYDDGVLVPGSPDNGKDGWMTAQDGAGRTILFAVRIADRLPPSVRVEMTDEAGEAYEDGAWTNRSVTASVYASDESGIGSLLYRVTSAGGAETADWQRYEAPIAFSDDGQYVLSVIATDAAGNETAESRTVKIDRQGLTLSIVSRTTSGDPYPDGSWTNEPVTLTAEARSPNPEVGVTSVVYSLDGASWDAISGAGIVVGDEGIHTVAFRATDGIGVTREEIRTIKLDATAPRWPGGAALVVASKGTDRVALSWNGFAPESVPAAISRYRVYEGSDLVADVPADATEATATGLRPGARYEFTVQAVDEAGNESANGPRVSATTDAAVPPVDPTDPTDPTDPAGPTDPTGPTDPGTPIPSNPPDPPNAGEPGKPPGPADPADSAEPSSPPKGGNGESSGPLPAFRDLDRHWASERIREAVGKGIATGYPDGTFRPDREITRAEFVALLMRAMKPRETLEDRAFADEGDVPAWAKPAIHGAVRAGILLGDELGNVRPDAPITRAEMAALAFRALSRIAPTSTATEMTSAVYADASLIPAWAKPAIGRLGELGVMNGRGGGKYAPGEAATRAEAVVAILNLLAVIPQDGANLVDAP